MGKKLLNILLTVVIAGFVGYLVANWTLKRRLQEQEEVATVVSGTADKKSVPQRRVEVTNEPISRTPPNRQCRPWSM